jgi:hypothetical protein
MTAAVQRVRGLDTASLLRLGVLGLALVGILGTTIELVFLEHWNGLTQQIVWPALLVLLVALVLIVWRPSPTKVWTARALALAIAFVAVVGIVLHVHENVEAGPLDRHYADTWDSLGAAQQYWLAITGQVGPAPTLAPGALAEISFALLLGTLHIPMASRPER